VTNEELDTLWDFASRATKNEWQWAKTPTHTRLAAAWWMIRTIFHNKGGCMWGVLVGSVDDPRWVAVTGNGSDSKANSAYLVAVQPSNIRNLCEALIQERARANDLQEQLDYIKREHADA
jgi:hypothetical protein